MFKQQAKNIILRENDLKNPWEDPTKRLEKCPCCFGTGVQTNKITGIRDKCPCCDGTGTRKRKILPDEFPKKIW